MNAEQIAQQIQELEKLADEMANAENLDAETFEQISQQIQEYQLQQNKLADEAKYLEESDIQRIYGGNGGKETISFAKGITNTQSSLDQHLITFKKQNEQSQVVFLCEKSHWLTVRLEKTPEDGIIYQVADSMPETTKAEKIACIEAKIHNILYDSTILLKEKNHVIQALIDSTNYVQPNREERIDALMNCQGITKIPFKSEKQQNGYDCGKFAATNASLMKKEFDAMRKNSEKEKASQPTILPQQKKGNIIDDIKNKLEQGSMTTEQAIKSIECIKGRVENILHNACEQENKSELQQKSIERLLERIDALGELHMKISQQKPQKPSRLSSASTASFFSSNSNRSYSPQLKNLQSQRSSSTSSFGSNISMQSHSNEFKRQPSAINQDKSPKGFHIV